MITANEFFGRVRYPGCPKTGSWELYRLMVLNLEMHYKGIKEQGFDLTSPPLQAYVNHGMWKVKCECSGGEKAWEEGWFMCQSCYNSRHKHQYRRSIFPKSREAIEKLLALRPLINRNWRPGETLAFLKADNQEHRAELLEVA